MKLLMIVIAALLIKYVCAKNSREKRTESSAKIIAGLYMTLKNIAFLTSPVENGIVQNRFVLLSPGQVLNYWDYYPGEEYEESIRNLNQSAMTTMVPPSVMERWFDLADAVVGADPFTGGVTGKSLSKVYETILSGMDILGFGHKTTGTRAKYDTARSFLTAIVTDRTGMSVTGNITRLSLYEHYKAQYAQRKLDMEEAIEDARKRLKPLDYQMWFQRNYPLLNSRVESAYTNWLTFGEKNLVESYKTYLDSSSGSSTNLAKARLSLHASGVSSLDRSRTTYPVSFEPGNWYRYLLPK